MRTALVGTFYETDDTGNVIFNIAQTCVITRQARESIPTIGFAKDFLAYFELLIVFPRSLSREVSRGVPT